MKNKLRDKMLKFDGKSRVSNDLYRKNYDEIFKKGVISNEITLGDVKDFYEETQKEKKELEESYQESLRQTQERKEKDGN
jgi:polyhydroxyalkanoate synthesis regulator phasin